MDCMLNLLVYELQEAQFPIRAPRPTYGPVRARDGDHPDRAGNGPQFHCALRGDGPERTRQ